MAIGDDATAAGYPLVPESGESGRVRWGSREINFTRDLVAQVKALLPVGKSGFRSRAGVSSGTAAPTGGDDGDIYLQILP